MLIQDMGIAKKTVNALNKAEIYTCTDLARLFPRKYHDYRQICSLTKVKNEDAAVAGYVKSVGKRSSGNISYIEVEAIDEDTGITFRVVWYGMSYLWERIKELPFKVAIFCGTVTYDAVNDRYRIQNPYTFSEKEKFKGKIFPVYKKIKLVSEEMLVKLIHKSLTYEKDPLPEVVVQKTKLMRYEDALRSIHMPESMEDIEVARKRIIFNDVLYFCIRMKQKHGAGRKDSPFIIKTDEKTKQFIAERPFRLTEDQKKTVEEFTEMMRTGQRINGLVQGDVGCGKTMIAIISMFLMAENGYQSVLMAPTSVLAKQHYDEISEYAASYGFRVSYLSSNVKGKDKKTVLEDIKSGRSQIIIGTHSLISENVQYDRVGLVISDEEHRFGVTQLDTLEQKAKDGAHVITMSATPIPRTLAEIIYGEDKKLYTIKSMPNGRIPVQTAINNNDVAIMAFIEKQLNEGHQAYIVCPLIEENKKRKKLEDDLTESKEKPVSAEQAFMKYSEHFTPQGYNVAMVNGRMVKEECDKILQEFKDNKVQILVSTTVVEVGVNVPNANVMVIENAEYFGLAQLHQLRGRVGRGSTKSYCVLQSKYKDNERLQVLSKTTDGFQIAQADLKLRGIGDLLGTKQSGENYYSNLIMAMPHLYECVKKYAEWIMTYHKETMLLQMYEEVIENVA